MSRPIPRLSRRTAAPTSRLSCTVKSANTSRPCGICTTPRATIMRGDAPVASSPSIQTVPARGATRPLTAFSTVVFPEPLPPRSAMMAFGGTVNETSRSTCVGPYRTSRCWTSSIVVPAEVCLNDIRIAADVVGTALGNLVSRVHDDHPFRYLHHEPDHVFDHHERDAALVTDTPEQDVELGNARRAQADCWLIEQHDFRIADERARDLDDALLAERQRGARAAGDRPHADEV